MMWWFDNRHMVEKFSIKKILIIQTASIGDVVLATPVIEKLYAFYPDATIHFLVKRGIESLVTGNPCLHKVLVWNKSAPRFAALRELIAFIRHERYDVVVNLQRFATTGLMTTLSGAKIKLGFSKNPFSLFFTRSAKHRISADPENSEHEVHRNLSVIDYITDNSRSHPVKLYPSQQDYAKVSQYKTRQYITISPASLWFTKQFPDDRWVQFVKSLEPQMHLYLLGAKGDYALCEKIIGESGHSNSINLSGKLTFLESAALMKDALMNYVNDSAPLHFASAMDAPVTAVFCSTVPAFGFTPLSANSAVVEIDEPLACRPCGLHGYNECPEKHFKCARNISLEKLKDRLNQSDFS